MTPELIVLAATVAASMLIVRIGGVALEMTGMDPSIARFQSLSAFTGTGFTTREAEDIVRHPQRRKIASVLIMLGYAGVVTVIASAVRGAEGGFTERGWYTLAWAVILGLLLVLLYRLFLVQRVSAFIDANIRKSLQGSLGLEPAKWEEILTAAQGWGIVRMEVPDSCFFAGMTLKQSRLRDEGMLVLAIERGNAVIPSPGPNTAILAGDILLAYGQTDRMEQMGQEYCYETSAPTSDPDTTQGGS
jgi:hypothetical protein